MQNPFFSNRGAQGPSQWIGNSPSPVLCEKGQVALSKDGDESIPGKPGVDTIAQPSAASLALVRKHIRKAVMWTVPQGSRELRCQLWPSNLWISTRNGYKKCSGDGSYGKVPATQIWEVKFRVSAPTSKQGTPMYHRHTCEPTTGERKEKTEGPLNLIGQTAYPDPQGLGSVREPVYK